MMTVQPYITLPEIVPQQELQAWKDSVRSKKQVFNCPVEVRQFITAIADKLGDFGRIRNYKTMMSGKQLFLCGNEFEGVKVDKNSVYPVNVPLLVAVDHQTSMLRLFRVKGKQGLIDFCKNKVKGTELEQVLEILTVHVFHEERPEFKKMLNDIESAKSI